jgi:hypothetical protein
MTTQKSNEYFDGKKLKFNFDLSDCNFEMDILQDKLLQFYIRTDHSFRKAFYTNYTREFFQFIKDKANLGEALHLSTIGTVRGGKSYAMISICAFHQACYNKYFTIDYICGNAFEYLDKLKVMPKEQLVNRIFLIDEEKQSVFNIGSVAKKLKLTDVANIIAINNISTILINPIAWANENAFYGLRIFGKCRKNWITRCMLYNLQAGGRGNMTPIGNVYIPAFTKFLPKDYADELEKQYLKKKNDWVDLERTGQGDVLAEQRKNHAKRFMEDEVFMNLTTKTEKITYVTQKLGSEFTLGEVRSIIDIVGLLEQGINLDKE